MVTTFHTPKTSSWVEMKNKGETSRSKERTSFKHFLFFFYMFVLKSEERNMHSTGIDSTGFD